MKSKIVAQLKRILPTLAGLYIPTLFAIFVVVVICVLYNIHIAEFTQDPTARMQVHPLMGLLSNIGVLFWCVSATACFFGYMILRKRDGQEEIAQFLLASGLVTSVLLLDDLFLFHEALFPEYVNIAEKEVYCFYGIFVGLYLVIFYRTILKTEYLLLLLAIAFFSLSIFVDFLRDGLLPWQYLLEDAPKLFGIVTWCAYFVRVSYQALSRLPTTKVFNLNL